VTPLQEARIVFLDRESLPLEMTLRAPSFPHRLTVHARTAPEDVAERIADADIVITNKVPVRRDAILGATRLRFIAISATGTDPVDLATCRERGITVSNVRGYAVATVPEHTFALILALRRSLVAYRQSVLDGRWQAAQQFCFFDHPIGDLAGSTLGIIGGGTLGSAVGRLGEAFSMQVLFAGRKGDTAPGEGRTPFDEVLRRSDVLTLHCPLNEATRGLIGSEEFARMERRPLLINVARGGIVDEAALAEAVESGQIAGAGIDVASSEPPPLSNPLMRIASHPAVLLTPHVAWASRQAIQALADQTIENIDLFHAGTPRYVVT